MFSNVLVSPNAVSVEFCSTKTNEDITIERTIRSKISRNVVFTNTKKVKHGKFCKVGD